MKVADQPAGAPVGSVEEGLSQALDSPAAQAHVAAAELQELGKGGKAAASDRQPLLLERSSDAR
jgi:hypothetical protein